MAFALLGNALTKKLTNMTFEMYVEEKIIKPLGLTATGFEFTDRYVYVAVLPYLCVHMHAQTNGQTNT